MEGLAHAVAGVVAHDAVLEAPGVLLDDAPDDIDFAARPHGLDAALHGRARALDEGGRFRIDPTDRERGVGVAVDTIEVGGHVQVDQVALAQLRRIRDAVADDLVDRRADRLGESHVAQTGRVGAVVAHVFVGDPVELVGGDSGGDRLRGLGQSACGNTSRTAYPLNRLGGS